MDLLSPDKIPRFRSQLTVLPMFAPQKTAYGRSNGEHCYEVDACSFYQQVLPPGMPKTLVFGFGGLCRFSDGSIFYQRHSPGPTFMATRHIPIHVSWNNQILSALPFPIDPTVGWANPNRAAILSQQLANPHGVYKLQWPVPFVPHLHGGEVAPRYDGHPHSWRTSNGLKGPLYETSNYIYPNEQQSTSLWYHDHCYGISRLTNYAGLSGFYILSDPKGVPGEDSHHRLPSGDFDIPLLIQDRSFCCDGSLFYPSQGVVPEARPYWVPEFYGNTAVVNGKVWPNLQVEQTLYRFRILNACNTRIITLSLSNKIPFIQIGTDGGVIASPTELSSFTLSPGERIDVLVDFSDCVPGSTMVLKNTELFEKVPALPDIMQFTVRQGSTTKQYPIPRALDAVAALAPGTMRVVTTLQEKNISPEDPSASTETRPLGMLIDGQLSTHPPENFSQLGSTFLWDIINLSTRAHSMHIHLVFFQILSRQRVDSASYQKEWDEVNGTIPLQAPTKQVAPENYLLGSPLPPEPYEYGWKDTLIVPPGCVTRIIVRMTPTDIDPAHVMLNHNYFCFDPCEAPHYVLNCQNPEHEDNDMLRPHIITRDAAN